MTTVTTKPTNTTRRPQSGPPLLVPVLAYAVLTIAAVAVNASTPHPDATGQAVLAYTATHSSQVRVGAWLLLGSAAPLAATAAAFYRRLRALGVTAPGSAIALVGGTLAAGALSLSGTMLWTGGRLPVDAPSALARALADIAFLSGGPAFAMAFGLLLLGISVPALLLDLLPKPVVWIGLGLGVVGELSSFTLVASAAADLLPLVRFGGLLWLIASAALLPATRHQRSRTTAGQEP